MVNCVHSLMWSPSPWLLPRTQEATAPSPVALDVEKEEKVEALVVTPNVRLSGLDLVDPDGAIDLIDRMAPRELEIKARGINLPEAEIRTRRTRKSGVRGEVLNPVPALKVLAGPGLKPKQPSSGLVVRGLHLPHFPCPYPKSKFLRCAALTSLPRSDLRVEYSGAALTRLP